MDKNSTILELRWGGKRPRIIYEDGVSILFLIAGDYGSDMVTWQEKIGLGDFYYEDYDRYHGSSWKGLHNFELCEWIQNVTLALEKNGVSKNNMYLATREIFSMKNDPTNEETIDTIYEILGKYFGNVTEDFNKRNWDNTKPDIPGYDFVYRYTGIKDLIGVFLTGYACHHTKCMRYKPGDDIFNGFRSLRYKDMFYRMIYSANKDVDKEKCLDISTVYDRHYKKIETVEQTMKRIRDLVIASETAIEELLTKNCITSERTNITKETKDKIIETIDKEILENKKDNRYSGKPFLFSDYDLCKVEMNTDTNTETKEVMKEKER